MSKEALAKVVQRAISDASFRRQLNSDTAGALRGFDLTADEVSALRKGDAGRLSTLGVDQRMSKAFAIGGMAAATRLSQSDLSAGGPSMVDDASGLGKRTVIPADPKDVGSADAPGSEAWRAKLPTDPDRLTAGDADGGADKVPGRIAPEGNSTVRTGDDWKFTDRAAAADTSTVRAGDDYKFTDRAAAQGSVAPVEGSPEATAAAQNASAGGGMANYPAHDGLAGPSAVGSARAGDDWARTANADDSGRIGSARLDDASGGASGGATINDDPDGFLAANANADLSGSVTRANIIHDDPDGFLAANANASGGSAGDGTAFLDESDAYNARLAGANASGGSAGETTAFIDESESYLTKVGYDPNVADTAVTDAHDRAWSGDDLAGPSSVEPDADGGGNVAPDGGPNITP